MSDLRFALRSLRRTPAFTLVAVLSLALGAGANTAIFSLIDSVMLKMLPVDRPAELSFLQTKPVQAGAVRISMNLSNAAVRRMQQAAPQTPIAHAHVESKVSVSVNGQSEPASAHFVSNNYFSMLGVPAILGRILGPDDDNPNARVAVLDFAYFRRRFGADAHILGREIVINGVPVTIVGVTPREFYGLSADSPAELMLPYATLPQIEEGHPSGVAPKPDHDAGTVIARHPNAAQLSAILRETELERAGDHPSPDRLQTISKAAIDTIPASQGLNQIRDQFSDQLKALMAVVGMVMLIACANIANLLTAKSAARRREIAIRMSLGATRAILIRQLLTESFLLSLAGGAVGILFAIWARDAIVSLAGVTIAPDWNLRVLAFTAAISILNAFLFGLVPAFRATRSEPIVSIKRRGSGFGRVLVSAQIALSLALLIGAALFLATFRNANRVDLGYARDHILLTTIDPGAAGYKGARVTGLYRRALDRAAALPGVRSASLMSDRLMSGMIRISTVTVPGYTPQKSEDPNNLWVVQNYVGPNFLSTAGMHLISGRDFSNLDTTRPVAIVNQAFANHFFAGSNPVGRTISWGPGQKPVEIVGLIANIKVFSVRDTGAQDVALVPLLQQTDPPDHATLVIRSAADPARLAPALRASLTDLKLPPSDIATMDSQVEHSLSQPHLLAILSTFFGILAVALASIGLYGVLTYSVSRRTTEIGIRMALGAQRSTILNMILSETAITVAAGIAGGLAISIGAARLVKSLLFGVTPTDATSILAAIAILASVALTAGLLPARRASRVDPMVALRHE
jgi:predicted permease